MRRSDHPSRPSAITCSRFSALKTLAIPAAGAKPTAHVNVSAPGAALAGFQVSINGRFWVSTEDAPIGPTTNIRAFNHLLGECGVTFFATPALARTCRRGFPRSLGGAPMLLPTDNTALRRSLDDWFESEDIRPRVASEFEDSALLMAFGQAGMGLFPAPSAIERQVRSQYGVVVVGRLDTVRERFYAISGERRLKHPAVVAISEAARQRVFG